MARDEEQETAESVRWAVSRLSQRLRAQQAGGDGSLTRLGASVLANLRHSGPLSVSALAEIEGLQPQSLTRVLNALAEDGLLVRHRDEHDRRQQQLAVTDSGLAALSAHIRDGNAWLAEALRRTLTPAERAVVRVAAELLLQVAAADPAHDERALGAPGPL